MFNFFKKKTAEIKDEDYLLLGAIVNALLVKYPYLKGQVSKEFIVKKRLSELGDRYTYSLSLNQDLAEKYSNKSVPNFFIIKGIGVWNNAKKSYEPFDLHILEGMLIGYRVESDFSQLNADRIDVSSIEEKHFNNNDKEELMEIIGNLEENILVQLDIESTYKIEVEEGKFYVLKDFQDGNYIAMDEKGAVYGLIHDPYEIERIYDDKDSFFNALRLGVFDMKKYINKKLS